MSGECARLRWAVIAGCVMHGAMERLQRRAGSADVMLTPRYRSCTVQQYTLEEEMNGGGVLEVFGDLIEWEVWRGGRWTEDP